MNLTSVQISIDENINADVSRLLDDIIEEFKVLIPGGPFLGYKPLSVLKYPDHPITITTVLPAVYLIGLTPDRRIYDQLTYQFSHEMTHVYADPRNNNWLIESFCEAMSLIMLERIGLKWVANPEVYGCNWYSVNFERYKVRAISNYLIDLDLQEKDIKDFKLAESVKSLTSPINRQINFILAHRILNYYKKTPDLLKLIPFFHFTSSKKVLGTNEFFITIHPDIDRFESNLPDELKRLWDDFKGQLE